MFKFLQLLAVVCLGVGCVAHESTPDQLQLAALTLKQPSAVLEYIAKDTPLTAYEVVSSQDYIAFLKTTGPPLDLDNDSTVRFAFGHGQHEFNPCIAAPPPPFWAEEIWLVSHGEAGERTRVPLPAGARVTYPGWSPDGRHLAFVLRQKDDFHLALYSPNSNRLHIAKSGDLSLWILGQTVERGSALGDLKAPYYWSKDSNRIVYGKRLHQKRCDAEMLTASAVVVSMRTPRMSEVESLSTVEDEDGAVELSGSWRRYLFESEIVEINAGTFDERVISARGLHRYLIPFGRKDAWLAITFPQTAGSAGKIIKLSERGDSKVVASVYDDGMRPSNTRVFSTTNDEGMYLWASAGSDDEALFDCFFFKTPLQERAKEVECINGDNRIAQVWHRGHVFVLRERSSDKKLLRVFDSRSRETTSVIDMGGQVDEETGRDCRSQQWWPVATFAPDDSSDEWGNTDLLISTTCGDSFRYVAIDSLWQIESKSMDLSPILTWSSDFILIDALGVSDENVLVLKEEIRKAPTFCMFETRSGVCRRIKLKQKTLDVDQFSRTEVLANRKDGISLRGVLFLPNNRMRQIDDRYPTIIWQYPDLYVEPTDFVAGQTIQENLNSANHIGIGVAQWLPTAFLELGFAVLLYPDWPYLGIDGSSTYGPQEQQIAKNAAAHLSALEKSGLVDMARVGIAGHSKGGNDALISAAANPGIAFAMAFAPGVNSVTTTPAGWALERRSYWEHSSHYLNNSPILKANEIKQPVLLIHPRGDANQLTPASDTRSFGLTMSRLNGIAKTVLLPGGNHDLSTWELRAHTLYEVERWLKATMGYLSGEKDE